MHIVITGANRGIGLELARQYLGRGDSVRAAVREPGRASELAALGEGCAGRLRVEACDVESDEGVRAFAAAVTGSVDLLINNAGVKGERDSLEALDLEDAMRTYRVNALGPMRLTRALLPALRRAGAAKIVNLSSDLGSIGENIRGGDYGYRMSKAALNMATRSLANDLRGEGILAVVLSPGWVQTDMGGPEAPTPVALSAAGLIGEIDRLTLADSGGFLDFRSRRIPW
jgi:NAD(P)-dependent dehydrogenase (short-subunit alcohol dehydrogenase family)